MMLKGFPRIPTKFLYAPSFPKDRDPQLPSDLRVEGIGFRVRLRVRDASCKICVHP